ncbi:kinase-like domain-containing protein [Phlebopus sp. FC_14]|nr:kinase-like domain-containing protein [Phlebopus sp. FC_14]
MILVRFTSNACCGVADNIRYRITPYLLKAAWLVKQRTSCDCIGVGGYFFFFFKPPSAQLSSFLYNGLPRGDYVRPRFCENHHLSRMSITRAIRSGSRRFRSVLRRHQPSSNDASSSQNIHEENIKRYCCGGYHPVRIRDEFHGGKYKVLSKLGYGLYSTVWLVRNTQTKQHVALKILTADTFDGEKDSFELDILQCISNQSSDPGTSHVLGLLDEFRHVGPNGQHVCLVFKPMDPDMVRCRRLFPQLRIPIPIAKKMSRDLVAALVFLHDTCSVIHTDIKPQNILVETTEMDEPFQRAPSSIFLPSEPVFSANEDLVSATDVSFRLADFGTSSCTNRHLTEWIQPQMLRAPEVILGAGWDHKVNIWNLGLIIWELVMGQLCFDGQASATTPYSSEAHLVFPETLLDRSEHQDRFFDLHGNGIWFPPRSLNSLCTSSGVPDEEDRDAFLGFIESTLALEPRQRPDARELLNTRWLKSI